MSIEKRTIIDQIEITRNGVVRLRLDKQLVDGEKVLKSEYHRAGFEPGADLNIAIQTINNHLVALGEVEVSPIEWERVRRVVDLEHTPEVVTVFQAKVAADVAAAERKIAPTPTPEIPKVPTDKPSK